MIRECNNYSIVRDYMDESEGIVYAHLHDLETESESVKRLDPPQELEYVFQLIRDYFLYIHFKEGYIKAGTVNDKSVYILQPFVQSLPFNDEANIAHVEQWNDLVNSVKEDFKERRDKVLRGKVSYDQLDYVVKDLIEDFESEDRKRLDPRKLLNLIVFVYDYCMLTMREAKLYPYLDLYVKGQVRIREKQYFPPLRICASILNYEPLSAVQLNEITVQEVNGLLPRVKLPPSIQNPHATNSNCSAMFADLMHKFFLSFGLQKQKGASLAKGERLLILEFLRIFGFYGGSDKESRFVTTVLNKNGDYFSKCNLRTWIRSDQAYSYLMCCSIEDFLKHKLQIDYPFIDLANYSPCGADNNIAEADESDETVTDTPENEQIPVDSLLDVIIKPVKELAGTSIKVTHTEHEHIDYAVIIKKRQDGVDIATWDSRLDYVIDLVKTAFDYITVLPVMPKILIVRNDQNDSLVLANLISSLGKDLLGRIDSIPRGIFSPEEVKVKIHGVFEKLPKTDRLRLDEEKFYVLFLFIFDYVYLTYKEAAISPHLKQYNASTIQVGDDTFSSTILIDDMLITYLDDYYEYVAYGEGNKIYQRFRIPKLYVPEKNLPLKFPACSVKNMAAMFYDLFFRFFKPFGLSMRSDAKYLPSKVNDLIAELASFCGITENKSDVRAMFMTNKDYFQKSALHLAIREGEYDYLMMNNMSDELFGSKKPSE